VIYAWFFTFSGGFSTHFLRNFSIVFPTRFSPFFPEKSPPFFGGDLTVSVILVYFSQNVNYFLLMMSTLRSQNDER